MLRIIVNVALHAMSYNHYKHNDTNLAAFAFAYVNELKPRCIHYISGGKRFHVAFQSDIE